MLLKLFLPIFLLLFSSTLYAAPTLFSSIRGEVDFIIITKPNYGVPEGESTDYYQVDSQSALGFGVMAFLKDSILGFGLHKGTYTEEGTANYRTLGAESKYKSEDDILLLNAMLKFGDRYSFGLGFGFVLSGSSELTNENPVCRDYDESGADVSGYSLFTSLGFPISKNISLTAGARALFLKATYQKQRGYQWPHLFLAGNLGLEFHL